MFYYLQIIYLDLLKQVQKFQHFQEECHQQLDINLIQLLIWELYKKNNFNKRGSITSVQTVYVPADDLTDPAPATTFSHLDATTVLSRQIASLGIYPAVDPLNSTSRILEPEIVGNEHYKVARET